ncbi:GNAT family N-acetyltransferase [Paenibacillus sp. FSL W8-0426]|uniref:GNAT family N-acetyltransferase n=1 Tax=Paenibacillus sp. FSL W8-0426 TaxID=2921714 RepID=UPI0030D8C872
MQYNLKLAGPDDVVRLGELFNQYRMFYGQESDEEGAVRFISERMEREESVILAAVCPSGINGVEQIAGFAQLYPSFSSVSMGKIWILNDLYVHPDHRGQGIAGMLLDAAREMAYQDKAIRIVLSTAKDNGQAQRIYEAKGYVQDAHFLYYELDLLP